MNSSGVIGAVSRSVLAARQVAGVDLMMQAVADGAVADLVVILQADDEPVHRHARRIGAAAHRPCARSAGR